MRTGLVLPSPHVPVPNRAAVVSVAARSFRFFHCTAQCYFMSLIPYRKELGLSGAAYTGYQAGRGLANMARSWLRSGRNRTSRAGRRMSTRLSQRMGRSRTITRNRNRRQPSVAGIGITGQHDKRLVYLKRTMPRYKKRRWKSFINKVAAVSEKDLGTRSVLFNRVVNYSGTDSSKQMVGTITLYGQESTNSENNELDIIKERYPSYYFRYYEKILSFSKGSSNIIEELSNEWWYGQTGTGKSYRLWQQYPDHYQKELNKWWDHYQGQSVVAIEEWCPKNEVTASALKIWSDRYPFTGQIKGGTLQRIRPQKIIVLSNYSIEQCFTNEEDREPIKRRFKEVYFPFQFKPERPRREGTCGIFNSPVAPNAPPGVIENPIEVSEETLNMDFLDDIDLTNL